MGWVKAMATGVALMAPLAAWADPEITVTGEGQVSAAPDMATVSMGVTSTGATAQEAMQANATALQQVMAKLGDAGIAEADIQTRGLQLNPDWSEGNDRQITGYTAANMVTVKVRALDSVGGVLDAVVADGANTLNGIAFDLSDPKPAVDQARKLAVADAMERARQLTDAAGVSLGRIVSISEGGVSSSPQPAYRMAAADARTPISGGEVTREAQVTIVFELGEGS
ncbi:SIMPL domain-containing protein [Falsirhodobacter sp. alg1]|uniref:SIMPL domain-containing protein n=1 Tax=Falsirhodobacter sp. alg1 TaxID=1472418 RepID=UPI0005EDD53E|nr:SIMPL domain-containing protein [Falsirhodobacter sp. alg1]